MAVCGCNWKLLPPCQRGHRNSGLNQRQVRSDGGRSQKVGRKFCSPCGATGLATNRIINCASRPHSNGRTRRTHSTGPRDRAGNAAQRAVSASRALRAYSGSCLRPRPRDCTPPTDFHLCAEESADTRFRQLVAWPLTHTQTGNSSLAKGRRISLSLTDTPPHSHAGIPTLGCNVERCSRRDRSYSVVRVAIGNRYIADFLAPSVKLVVEVAVRTSRPLLTPGFSQCSLRSCGRASPESSNSGRLISHGICHLLLEVGHSITIVRTAWP
jgi:hypothetical protein